MARDDVRLIKALIELAEESPDKVYQSPDGPGGLCQYVHVQDDGSLEPGCIVGAALVKCGIPIEDLHPSVMPGSARFVLEDLNESGILSTDAEVRDVAITAQVLQDSRVPWGDSVDIARGWMKKHEMEHYSA